MHNEVTQVEAMANALANADLDGPDPDDYWKHLARAALRTNQAPDAPEAGLAGELAGRIESRLRAFVAADKGSANEARQAIALADLIGCNERAILAALNHADPASDDVQHHPMCAAVSGDCNCGAIDAALGDPT